jgi:hypothetical protein
MNANHFMSAKIFEEEVNSPLKGEFEKHPSKKKSNPFRSAIVNFFAIRKPSKKIICNKKCLLRIWGFLLLKIICPCNLLKVYG